MKAKEIKEIAASGESALIEFKRKGVSPEKLAKEISALANTKGGLLLVGIDDDGTIVGVRSEKGETDTIEKACGFFIEPPIDANIEIVAVGEHDVVVLHIKESQSKPHTVEVVDAATGKSVRRAYIRLGEKSVIASKEMYRLMTDAKSERPLKLSIGDTERRLFTYLEKYERITVKEFAKLVNISSRRAERTLINLVRAGVVLIHNDTTRDYFTLSPKV